MDIEGTYTLQAPVAEVWQCLKDTETLQRALSGLERLEFTGQHTYAFSLRIKQAPLRGVYAGRATMGTDFSGPPLSRRLVLEGDGQHNPFSGLWNIRLSQQQDNTVVAYSGTLNPGRINALLPPTLVKGAIKILIQQFFMNLAEQLRTTTGATYETAAFDGAEAQTEIFYERDGQDDEGSINALDPYNEGIDAEASLPARTTLHTLVRRVGLGNHDPILEDMWVTRFKRFGAFSVLLLLVWIGTRLPRRLLPRN